jgi:hypothetical protein
VIVDRIGDRRESLARLSLAAGVFVSVVSVSLFLYAISPIASVIASSAFIAAGVVGRQRASSPVGYAMAVAALSGGIVAAIVAIALAAAGR